MKNVSALALTVLSSLSQAVYAQSGGAVDRLNTCSRFEGVERLKCVDEILGEMTETLDAAPSRGPNWIISETTSPVDYTPQISALTNARAPSPDAASSLAILCRSGRTELVISTTGSWKQAAASEAKVAYRINEEPSIEQHWKTAETGRGLVFQGDVVRFLRSMPDGGRILVKVYAGIAPPHESSFQLVGLEPVRRKIAAACKWPQP